MYSKQEGKTEQAGNRHRVCRVGDSLMDSVVLTGTRMDCNSGQLVEDHELLCYNDCIIYK